jgi:hypothetical protein
MRQPALVVWALYLFLIPLYVIKSGLPQPGDVIVVPLIPMALHRWNGKLPGHMRATVRSLLWFTLWVCAVDYTWVFVMGSWQVFGPDSFMLYPLYYIYNGLVFVVVIVLYRRLGDVFLRVTVFSVTATVYVQVVSSLVFKNAGARSSLFFNNPNQLGYYALLAATLIALLHRRLQLRLLTSSLALVCCGLLAVVSASRAAAGGIAVLLVFLMFSNPKVIVVACVAALAMFSGIGPISHAIDASQQRVMNRGAHSNLSFSEERGYDRIWRNQQYLVLGAGEGGLSRFDTTAHVKNMEIHSSAGTILFSYGIVGSLLFVVFAWRVMRRSRLPLLIVLIPMLLYSGAHQGLRFTMLWILLAIFVVLKDDADAPQAAGRLAARVNQTDLPGGRFAGQTHDAVARGAATALSVDTPGT